MKNNASLVYALFLVVGDFLALLAAFSVAYILRVKVDPRPLIEQIPARDYFTAFAAVLPFWILINAFIGLYRPEVYERRFSELGRLFVGSFVGILVVIGYDFITEGTIFPARLVPVYGLILGFSFLFLFRFIARILRHLLFHVGIGISDVLVIGDTEATDTLVNSIKNTGNTGLRVVGVVGRRINGQKHFADFDEAIEKLKDLPHGIIQTELYTAQEKNSEVLQFAQEHHISYRFMPGNSDLFVGNIAVDLFAGSPVIAVHQTALIGWGRIVKRIFDIFVSFTLLILLSWLLLIIAFLELLFGKGPIFFRQMRLTRHNQEFKVFKFRTQKAMYDGTTPEEAFEMMGKPELAVQYRANGDFIENDPRTTRLGKFLRQTSLDELPQLFNVLRGDISLVGPRALIPQELNAYQKKHAILSVKSGLTGLAQVSGRKDISFEERRKLDMYYVQNWSFWFDLNIMFRTLYVIFRGS